MTEIIYLIFDSLYSRLNLYNPEPDNQAVSMKPDATGSPISAYLGLAEMMERMPTPLNSTAT